LTENKGISFEGNVMSLKDPAKLKKLKDSGVTRLSFGVQTFNEKIRKAVAVRAKIKDIYDTVEAIDNIGFPSYALDIIYNLPGENFEILENDLEKACKELKPGFIQTYRFNRFTNTRLDEKINKGNFHDPPTPQKEMDMFRFIMKKLKENGYTEQVLINFFGKEGQPCFTGIEHSIGNNRLNGSHMLGIGPGSMSYLGSRNYKTYPSIKQYMNDIDADVYPTEAGHISSLEERNSRVMVFFPNFTRIKRQDIPRVEGYDTKINYLLEKGYAKRDNDELCLTEQGKLWAGNISYLFYTDREIRRLQKSFYCSLTHGTNPFNQDRMNIVSK
jgi:oxygen-independent coproporphyrinogen-3 oxidase